MYLECEPYDMICYSGLLTTIDSSQMAGATQIPCSNWHPLVMIARLYETVILQSSIHCLMVKNLYDHLAKPRGYGQ